MFETITAKEQVMIFLMTKDSYSAIVAQLPEKQEYLCYSDERVMKKLFYVHEDLMPPP